MKIFLGGRSSRSEFSEIVQDIRAAAGVGATFVVKERLACDRATGLFCDESEPTLASLRDVDFFALFRSFPNEFSAFDVEALRRASPLAPIALFAGALCEGEDRTGESFPGVRRFYPWSQRSEGRRELARFFDASGATGLFAAPPTSTLVDERASAPPVRPRATDERLFLLGDDCALIQTLKETFASIGAEVAVGRLTSADFSRVAEFRPDRVVVDAPDLADASLPATLGALRARAVGASIDLLAFAPRRDEIVGLESSGVRVIAKPFDLDYLLQRPEPSSDLR